MGAISVSQNGPRYCHYDHARQWTGALSEQNSAALPIDRAKWMTGRAGTITVHHCATVRGSMPNLSPRMRPLFIECLCSS